MRHHARASYGPPGRPRSAGGSTGVLSPARCAMGTVPKCNPYCRNPQMPSAVCHHTPVLALALRAGAATAGSSHGWKFRAVPPTLLEKYASSAVPPTLLEKYEYGDTSAEVSDSSLELLELGGRVGGEVCTDESPTPCVAERACMHASSLSSTVLMLGRSSGRCAQHSAVSAGIIKSR